MRFLLLLVPALLATALTASEPAKPRTVTLRVKDGDVREILLSMQKQCAVKNLIVDPEVKGSATFSLRAVPCDTAFRVVFRTMGLAGQIRPRSIVTVDPR